MQVCAPNALRTSGPFSLPQGYFPRARPFLLILCLNFPSKKRLEFAWQVVQNEHIPTTELSAGTVTLRTPRHATLPQQSPFSLDHPAQPAYKYAPCNMLKRSQMHTGHAGPAIDSHSPPTRKCALVIFCHYATGGDLWLKRDIQMSRRLVQQHNVRSLAQTPQ